jgi:hypothetical protein
MNSMKCPVRMHAAVLRALIAAVMLALAGCATQDRAPAHVLNPPVEVEVSESDRWQIDHDIGTASLAATELAKGYARGSMERWRDRVRQHTEADFIPWFTGYWTQEWLAVKMAWYKLNAGDGTASAMERLAAYLQQQYHDRVLNRVAQEIDLNAVREQATKLYVRSLSEQLQENRQHDGIPRNQFDQRLKGIAAIAPEPPPARSASLYQLVRTDPIASLPAYAAMLAQIRKDARATEAVILEAGISPVATRTSQMLGDRLAISGGASAAAAAFGGIAGMMVSLGAAGFEAVAQENERPKMEAQLRESLHVALDEMCSSLMEDADTGVMAGVYHLSGQIEQSLVKTVSLPVKFEPLPSAVPLSVE